MSSSKQIRLNRAPLSCQPCRHKKRRCDRKLPCSSCSERNLRCQYADNAAVSKERRGPSARVEKPSPAVHQGQSGEDDVAARLRRLEEAVLGASIRDFSAPLESQNPIIEKPRFTLFGLQTPDLTISTDENAADAYISDIVSSLPPLAQARTLISHLSHQAQRFLVTFHIPSTHKLLEETYDMIEREQLPSIAQLLFLYALFTCIASSWTPDLLVQLNSTAAGARRAFQGYYDLSLSILDNRHCPIIASTTTLVAVCNLAQVGLHATGINERSGMLRMRSLLMAYSMEIPRLDTPAKQMERGLKGCDMIDIELQRRAWWNIVAFDWLKAFSGGPLEGSYNISPRHMNVNLPANVDDELITSSGILVNNPLSVLTCMSTCLFRIKIADLCRQVVDASPSQYHESREDGYTTVLTMDKKFRELANNLPEFFRITGPISELSTPNPGESPSMNISKIGINFTIQSRLCRLHREFYLEGLSNPKYAYSHTACLNAAQTVLDLQAAMNSIGMQTGMNPSWSWVIMQHVYIAALILANDISFNPTAPNAQERKAKVLAMCNSLEKSMIQSGAIMDGMQKNLQTVLAALGKEPPHISSSSQLRSTASVNHNHHTRLSGTEDINNNNHIQPPMPQDIFQGIDWQNKNTSDENWDKLWMDIVAIAPELDESQWDMLFSDVPATLYSL